METNKQQRKDIDDLSSNTVSLEIDEYNTLQSPFYLNILNRHTYNYSSITKGNNWVTKSNYIIKNNLSNNDELIFEISQEILKYKNITNIGLKLSVQVSVNGSVIENVGLSDGNVVYNFQTETIVNDQSDVYVNCSLFGLSSEDINTIINSELFYIIVNFNGKSLNPSLRINSAYLVVEFDEVLQPEIDSVENRLMEKYSEVGHKHTKLEITDFAHTHTKSDISDFSHTHTKSDISDFTHTHTKSDVTDFAHTHTKSDITNFNKEVNELIGYEIAKLPNTYSQIGHTHTKSNITDFSHTHTESEITDLGNYSQIGHTHTKSEISDINDILKIGTIIITKSNNSPSLGNAWTTKTILTGDFVDKATNIDKNPYWTNNGVNETLLKNKTILELDALESYVCNFILKGAFEILTYITPSDGSMRLSLISEDNKECRIIDSETSERLYKISRDELGSITVMYSVDNGANWTTLSGREIDTLTTEDCQFRFYNAYNATRSMDYHDFYINQEKIYEHRRVS